MSASSSGLLAGIWVVAGAGLALFDFSRYHRRTRTRAFDGWRIEAPWASLTDNLDDAQSVSQR